MRIPEIAFMAIIDDAKQLVADGVWHDVALLISTAKTEEERQAATRRGKERETFLKKWLHLQTPLAYGQHNCNKTYQSLVQAVIAAPEDISNGLPNLHLHAMTRTIFVNSLLKMSSSESPSAPRAPVLANGSFLPLLIEAHRTILSLCQESDKDARHNFVHGLFIYATRHLRIHFVPSHCQRSGAPGAPHRKPIFDSWAHLGLRDDASLRSLPQSHNIPSSSQRAAEIALTNALTNDSDAEWFIKDISVNTLYTILHKTNLPQDFVSPSISHEPYVDETYVWVKKAYDGKRHTHHLALIVAIIAASFLPNLFMPTDTDKRLFNSKDKEEIRKAFNTIDWVSRNKKGMSNKLIFIGMFTTFIIALYEPSSPLRQNMATAERGGLGDPWTKKHSTT